MIYFNYKALLAIFAIILTSCFWYSSPGSGLGSLADIDEHEYKTKYLIKYTDTLFIKYPQYIIPDTVSGYSIDEGYDFLNMTKFYFNEEPREIYFVQWEGTGFISVRMAYDVSHDQPLVNDMSASEKQRIKNRFRNEILAKLNYLISKSADRDSAIYVSPWVEINKVEKKSTH